VIRQGQTADGAQPQHAHALPVHQGRLGIPTPLLEDANERGDSAAAAQLLALAADQPGSYELYLDVVTMLNVPGAKTALLANPQQTTAVLHTLTGRSVGDRGNWATREEAERAIWWLLGVARLAVEEQQWPMLDAAVQGMCDWDGRWDRWDPRNTIRDWLCTLTGPAAATVASALRAQPHGALEPGEPAREPDSQKACGQALFARAGATTRGCR
jgi:hypothetical protein